ncbi:diacylglycerol kinase family protein [Maioricimonas rarisocia]|uniref:diacylglycerol kinase family protein n=1 Tax=Maioricimonas rarisocia TaxID=2528026 RepID=UPI0011A41C7E|nr:diacylglycerol kinase family protein [Maioricimonas rarisocia]
MADSPRQWRSTLGQAFRAALAGLAYAVATQRNFRIHLVAAAIVCGLGIWLRIDSADWAILALAIGLVWTAEMFNTAIETAVDLASPEYHRLAKIAKDCSAGGVLTAAVTAVIVGLIVLGPPLWIRLLGTSG